MAAGLRVAYLVIATPSVVLPTGSFNDQMIAWLNHVAADFTLVDASGLWTVGDEGILTYTGAPAIVANIMPQATFGIPGGGGNLGLGAFAMAHEGDLLAVSPAAPAVAQGGGSLCKIETHDGDFGLQPMSAFRQVAMTQNQTVQPVFGLQMAVASQDSDVSGFSVMIFF